MQDVPTTQAGTDQPPQNSGSKELFSAMVAENLVNSPLRAYWWNNAPNFGDGLSQLVLAKVSGRPIEHAAPPHAEVFAIGSIMSAVRQGALARRNENKPWVWGTGLMTPGKVDFQALIRVAAVRGPLTIQHLRLPLDTPMGDPGLLASDVVGVLPPPKGKIGIILHFSQRLPRDLAKKLNKDGRFVRIHAKKENCLDVVRSIASCSHIMSSSLHGLIVADSFRIPSTWLDGQGIHVDPTFKFRDYALSIGRDIGDPRPLRSVFEIAEDAKQGKVPLPYEEGLVRTIQEIRTCFPQELRASTA
jgi:pyruvyltransferase